MKYGDQIQVTRGISAPGALMPAVGVVGKVLSFRPDGMVVCEFQPPFPIHGGGEALEDDNHPEGVRVYFNKDEIKLVES